MTWFSEFSGSVQSGFQQEIEAGGLWVLLCSRSSPATPSGPFSVIVGDRGRPRPPAPLLSHADSWRLGWVTWVSSEGHSGLVLPES